ncbi:MAG: PIN domain-containing protein [Rhodocyclaceae bacterium]|nr:PIN domain-containing protein [Rhodocyclaceae bacterium]
MTPDVNVLVAASRQDHPHHLPARVWLDAALDAKEPWRPLAILPMVASGFLRLVTHPKVFVEPTTIEAAQTFLRAVLDVPGVVLLPLGNEWSLFEYLCVREGLVGNEIPDAWIAAAAQFNNEHLVTFDKGFRRFMKPNEVTVLPP